MKRFKSFIRENNLVEKQNMEITTLDFDKMAEFKNAIKYLEKQGIGKSGQVGGGGLEYSYDLDMYGDSLWIHNMDMFSPKMKSKRDVIAFLKKGKFKLDVRWIGAESTEREGTHLDETRSDLGATSPGVNPGFGGELIGDNMNLADLSNDMVVRELNSYVGSISGEYLNPYHAIKKLRETLNSVGIDFNIPTFAEDNGEVSEVLIVHGGRFGKTGEESPEEITNDPSGQAHMRENPIKIHFTHDLSPAGSTLLTARLGE